MNRYSESEKLHMIELYESYGCYETAAHCIGCAISTVYYAVNPDKYEHHKEHVNYMQKEKR